MTSVFVVFGYTGEYSDFSMWSVAVYTNQENAEAHAKAASDWWKSNASPSYENDYHQNPYDPNGSCDYTGTEYSVEEFPLETFFKLKR